MSGVVVLGTSRDRRASGVWGEGFPPGRGESTVVSTDRTVQPAGMLFEPDLPPARARLLGAGPGLRRGRATTPSSRAVEHGQAVQSGPSMPQPGVPLLRDADRLPRVAVPSTTGLCWVGAHGGSGASTLAALVPGSTSVGLAWPRAADASGPPVTVVLVARSDANGLLAAQRAVVEWASGSVDGVRLLALVVVADAPGRLPRPLRQLRRLVGGGAPQCWELPWVEEWRRGSPPVLEDAPAAYRRLCRVLVGGTSVSAGGAQPDGPAAPVTRETGPTAVVVGGPR